MVWYTEEMNVEEDGEEVDIVLMLDDKGKETSRSGGWVIVCGDERYVSVEWDGVSVSVAEECAAPSPVSFIGRTDVEGIALPPSTVCVVSTTAPVSLARPLLLIVSVALSIWASCGVASGLVLLSASHSSHFHSSRCVKP